MADIRIKDLTTTASSTASDDFIAVDGTTNGTRKLNAFSPTFGGNATVTGTLTVNGTNPSSIPRLSLNSPVSETYNFGAIGTIQSADVSLEATSTAATGVGIGLVVRRTNGGEFARFINGAVTTRLANMSCDAAGTYFSISSAVSMYLDSTKTMLTGGNVLIGGTTDIPGTGGLKVFGTTASTTTSTGALVVGNGTSGGLGVGGSINCGGDIVVGQNTKGIYSTGYVTLKGYQSQFLARGTSSGWTSGLHFYSSNSDYSATFIHDPANGNLALFTNASSSDYVLGDIALQVTTAKQVQVKATTASTTTSSGALVVSGGVGVAGAIYAGGALFTVSGAGFNTPDWRFYQSGTSGYIRDLVNGQMALQFVSGNASTIQVYATGTQDSTTTTSGALVSSGGLGVSGAVNAGTYYGLVDGVTAPATAGGYARIYVDSADGDLKVKFGDGTVKTIATDS